MVEWDEWWNGKYTTSSTIKPFKSGNYGNYQPYNSVMDVFG